MKIIAIDIFCRNLKPAHLSRQFKQVCGLSPKEYKKQMANQRKPLDEI